MDLFLSYEQVDGMLDREPPSPLSEFFLNPPQVDEYGAHQTHLDQHSQIHKLRTE